MPLTTLKCQWVVQYSRVQSTHIAVILNLFGNKQGKPSHLMIWLLKMTGNTTLKEKAQLARVNWIQGGSELTTGFAFSCFSLSAKIWCQKTVQITSLATTIVLNASKLKCKYLV